MTDIIITAGHETIFSSKEKEDDYLFDLQQMKKYDWFEESVRCVLDELELDGPTVARLLYLFSSRFLVDNNENMSLSSDELRKQLHG